MQDQFEYERAIGDRRARIKARKGRTMSSRQGSGFGSLITGALLLGLVIGIAAAALGAVLLMWGTSLAHRDIAAIPALGFLSSFGVLLSLTVIGGALRGSKVEMSA